MQQQLRSPFGVQTGCKRNALQLHVCLQFPQLLLHRFSRPPPTHKPKSAESFNRVSVAGHHVNRLFISFSTYEYMLLTRITALLRSLLYSVFLLPFSSSWQLHR
jgi:hypothetical protein